MHPPPPGQNDNDMLLLLLVAAIAALGIAFAFRTYIADISAALGAIAWIHIAPFAQMSRTLPFLESLPVAGPLLFQSASVAHDFLADGGYAAMTDAQRSAVLSVAGRCAALVYAPLFLWLGLRARDVRADLTYRNLYTLEEMLWRQTDHWLTTRLARRLNPLKRKETSLEAVAHLIAEQRSRLDSEKPQTGQLLVPVTKPVAPVPWSRAQRPEEWLLAQGATFRQALFDAAAASEAPDRYEFREAWTELSVETVSELLIGQLGTAWRGFGPLRPCHRALAAVMALFYDYQIESANRLLSVLGALAELGAGRADQMDGLISKEPGLKAEIDEALEGHPGRTILEVANNHAWATTAFARMLEEARKDRGVLPPAAIVWLKAEDRSLWYTLSALGGEAVMVEAAGPMAHYRAERQVGRPLRRPAVYQAARALADDYLDLKPERIAVRDAQQKRSMLPGQQLEQALHARNPEDPDCFP